MTTTYPPGVTGNAVTEGDIELNAVACDFTAPEVRTGSVGSGRKRPVPLEAALVHEIGHVLGLPDVCGDHRLASGRPVTEGCTEEDRKRVMFAAGVQSAPSERDVAELCRLYPPL
jgi:hypothetical protein